MSRDDYWDRVDDYQRYADNKYDQKIFEEGLSKRSSDVYDALKNNDHDAAAWSLGISRESGHRSKHQRTRLHKNTNVSADDEVAKLIFDIKNSEFIPVYLQLHWVKGLNVITTNTNDIGFKCIKEFKSVFIAWKKANRPQQSIWDLGDTKVSFYDCEMLLIECKIDRISWLLSTSIN